MFQGSQQFTALKIGPLVRTNFSAKVHSVFERTANIRTPVNHLYVLTRSDVPFLPSGIQIDLPISFSFERQFDVGARLHCQDGILTSETLSFTVNLQPAVLVDTALENSNPPEFETVQTAWRIFVSNSDYANLINGLFAIVSKSELHSLLSYENHLTILKNLIGKGPGLTPAGDDFVIGYFAGHICANGTKFAMEIEPGITNDISFATLQEAVQGHFSEPLLTFAKSLNSRDADIINRDLLGVLAVGASSGVSGAFGFLMALMSYHYSIQRTNIDANITAL